MWIMWITLWRIIICNHKSMTISPEKQDYLLRCLKSSTQELSIPLIAEKFERTESDINIALKYWERMHLLTLEYDDSKSLTGIHGIASGNAEGFQDGKISFVVNTGLFLGLSDGGIALFVPGKGYRAYVRHAFVSHGNTVIYHKCG